MTLEFSVLSEFSVFLSSLEVAKPGTPNIQEVLLSVESSLFKDSQPTQLLSPEKSLFFNAL